MKTLVFKILGIIYFIGAFLFVLLFFQTIGSIFSSVVNLQFGQALLRFFKIICLWPSRFLLWNDWTHLCYV